MDKQEQDVVQDDNQDCCNVCEGSCRLKSGGWKWSILTLAVIIVAGLATTTVLAGEKSGDTAQATCASSATAQCPLQKAMAAKSSCDKSQAKAQGAAGEAETGAAKTCDKSAKSSCSQAKAQCADGAVEGKAQCAAGDTADKACCAKDAASCPKQAGKCPAKSAADCPKNTGACCAGKSAANASSDATGPAAAEAEKS